MRFKVKVLKPRSGCNEKIGDTFIVLAVKDLVAGEPMFLNIDNGQYEVIEIINDKWMFCEAKRCYSCRRQIKDDAVENIETVTGCPYCNTSFVD